MRDSILSFGKYVKESAVATPTLQIPFRRIISCGMGGSSIAGEVVSTMRDDMVVHWDYALPPGASSQDLVVCTSWSGNTAETLSSYDAARALNAHVVVIAGGGMLAEKAAADGVPCTLLPQSDMPPRIGASRMIGALLGFLGMADAIPTVDPLSLESKGKDLADAVGIKTPIFYSSYPLRKIAGWCKAMVNENAKRHAWSASFPSAAHNEIMGWQGPYRDSLIPVILRGDYEDSRHTKDLDTLVALLQEMGYTVPIVPISGSGPLSVALHGYLLALWISYHMAVNLGVDPGDTQWIDEFKKRKSEH